MSAYMIFTREKTTDQTEMDVYTKTVGPTMAGHPLKPLAFYGKHEDLGGAPTEGSVVVEFPTVEAAKGWYNSPAYREVREHRFKGAKYHVILLQGV